MRRFFTWYFFSYILLFVGFIFYIILTLPDVSVWKKKNPGKKDLMNVRAQSSAVQVKLQKISYRWISIGRVPVAMRRCVVVAEDASFWVHRGIDWFEVQQSLKKNLERGKFSRGGSTITQQVAKNLYLSSDKSIRRKLREWLIARRLEKQLRKTRILELYINIAQWGKNIYGIRMASARYFHKHPSQLRLDEMVRLAAVLPNPERLNPVGVNRAVLWRSRVILNRLHKFGFIDDDEFEITNNQLDSLYQLPR